MNEVISPRFSTVKSNNPASAAVQEGGWIKLWVCSDSTVTVVVLEGGTTSVISRGRVYLAMLRPRVTACWRHSSVEQMYSWWKSQRSQNEGTHLREPHAGPSGRYLQVGLRWISSLGHFPRSAAPHECTECVLSSCQFFEDEAYSNCASPPRGRNVGITPVIAVLSLKCQHKRCFFLQGVQE